MPLSVERVDSPPINAYPYLGVNKDGVIVVFTYLNECIVLFPGLSTLKLFYHSNECNEHDFRPWAGHLVVKS